GPERDCASSCAPWVRGVEPFMRMGRRRRAPPRLPAATTLQLQAEADAGAELDVVQALAFGRHRVIETRQVHARLRADREADARADVEAELGLAVADVANDA